MVGGIMEVVKKRVNAVQLAPTISSPDNLLEKDGEVLIKNAGSSIIDELYGIASGLNMTYDEIRDERLNNRFNNL